MSFDLFDFTESLDRAGVQQARVEHCSLGFGNSPEGYGSWHGGFVCHTRSGAPWVFLFGWCDTTGWGCQDGAYVRDYDHEPTREELDTAWGEDLYGSLAEAFQPEDFDETPADLNRFLVGEIDRFGEAASSPRLGVSESTDHSPIDQRMDSAPRTEQTGENR